MLKYGWTTRPRKSPFEIRKTARPCDRLSLSVRRMQSHPANKTQHTPEGSAKKTQRRSGVRMRYRGTFVQRNRKGRGMGDTPSWRPDNDAHCYSRALLVTLFFAAFWPENAETASGLRYPPCCILHHRFASLAACDASGPPIHESDRQAQHTPGWICNREFRAAPSRRTHGISLKRNSTITGCSKPWERACPGT